MKALRRGLALVALAVLAAAAWAEPVILQGGVSVEPPPDWIPLSAELTEADRTNFGDPELRRLMRQAAVGKPLVTFVRNTGRYRILPGVRVQTRSRAEVGRRAPADALETVAAMLARSIPDLRVVEGPVPTDRFGPGGAVIRIAYTIGAGPDALPIRSQIWMTTRDERTLLFSITMAEGEVDAMWREADAILDTVRIGAPGDNR